jgi:hypothetical protein
VLATDGIDLEAEDLASGETIACSYSDFAKHASRDQAGRAIRYVLPPLVERAEVGQLGVINYLELRLFSVPSDTPAIPPM